MFLYFPNATRVNANGEDEGISIYGGYGNVEKAMEQFSIWEDHYNYILKKCWIDIYEDGEFTNQTPIKSIREIVMEWKAESGIFRWEETTVIHKSADTLFVITRRPGWFIGIRGCMVDKFKKILQENGHKINHIRFVETGLGDVSEF